MQSTFPLRPGRTLNDYLLTAAVILATLLLTYALDRFALRLPLYEHYYEGSPAIQLLTTLNGKRIVIYVGLLAACIGLDRWRGGLSLTDLPSPAATLLVVAGGMQAYTLGLLDYNHFFDNWMTFDRLLLAGLGVLCIARPLYLPLFIIDLVLMIGQLRYPGMIGYDHVHKFIFPQILALFWSYLVVSRFVRVRHGDLLPVLLVMAPLSLWYIMAGVGKLELDWPNQNSLYNLFAAATDAGWLAAWPREIKVAMGDFLVFFQKPLLWSTIALEILLPLLLLVNRATAVAVTVSLMIFHLFVYLFSGILFWQWSLLELVFMYFIIGRPARVRGLFTNKMRLAYAGLLLLIPLTVHIGKLAWFDCGYINRYAFYLVDRQGGETEIDASYFSPYDTGFAKNRFYFLTREKTMAYTYGQCNDNKLLTLLRGWPAHTDAENLRRIEAFRQSDGMDRYDERRAATFQNFAASFVRNKNRYDPDWISHLAVPPHMQQGMDQRNLQVDDLDHLKIVYQEKVALPGLEYFPIAADTLIVSLSTQNR